jgi:transposase
MVVGCPVSNANGRGCAATRVSAARAIQRITLRRSLRYRLAGHAERSAILVGGLPANLALAGRWQLRDAGTRSACRCGWRPADPAAAVIDSRTLQSTPESGARAGYDGAKRKRGSKVHMSVDTLGHLLALYVTPADVGDREEVVRLAEAIQDVTGESVTLTYVDEGYTSEHAEQSTGKQGISLHVVKLPEAKRGFVLLPRRWVVERSFAWATRFRRLAKDYEVYASTLAGLHFAAFVCLMLARVGDFI